MDPKEIVGLAEAYMDVYSSQEIDEGAAGDVADRAAKLARQRKGQTPERKEMYKDLASKAAARERGPFQRGDTRTGLTASDRERRRESDAISFGEFGERGIGQHGTSTYGKGGITKNPRKLAQQKARGQHAESYDYYDIILSHLLDEGYVDTEETATVIMVNMSEGWRQSIVEGRDVERGEEDDSPAVKAHNKSLGYKKGKAGYAKRPNPANDPRYGSQY
jgi:hypothetical protein